MSVLEGNAKTRLLAWVFFFKTTYILWPSRAGASLAGLVVFLFPSAEPDVQCAELPMSASGLATRIRCAKTSPTEMCLWWESFSSTKELLCVKMNL